MKLRITPINFDEACQFVTDHHRHHAPPQGAKFAIACSEGSRVVGVVIAGRPVARHNDDGWTLEITRCATDGTRNACSMLYGAARRAAKALGYQRLITYTLDTEPGSSLRAAGFDLIGTVRGGSWSRPSRPRVDTHPLQGKLAWESK